MIRVILAALLSVLFCVPALLAQTTDRIVAIVNNEVITQSEVDRVLATMEAKLKELYSTPEELQEKMNQLKQNIVSQMVEEKVILGEAKKMGIKIAEEIIDERIKQIKARFTSEEQFEQSLEAQGLTLKDLRDRFRDQEMMKQMVDVFVRSQIKVDPAEIAQFYQERKDEFVQPEQAHVKSILIKVDESGDERQAQAKAKVVLERLKNGDSFEALAQEYSQGEVDLGYLEKGQLLQGIDEAIFSLEPGAVTDVIKTPQGFRIFKLEEKKPARPLDLVEAQGLINDILYKEQFAQKFQEWITGLKQKASISLKDEAAE